MKFDYEPKIYPIFCFFSDDYKITVVFDQIFNRQTKQEASSSNIQVLLDKQLFY
jgi:hypothetical protein